MAASFLAVASVNLAVIPALVGFFCIFAASILWAKRTPLSLVSPVVLLQLSALAYSVFLPISKMAGWQLHIARPGLIASDAFDAALVLSLASSVAMMLGAQMARSKEAPVSLNISTKNLPGVWVSALLLLFIGAGATLGLLGYGGGVNRLIAMPYGARYLAVEAVSFLKYGPVLLAFSVAVFYFALQSNRRVLYILGMGVAVALLLLDAFVMERRTPIYIAIIGVVVIRAVFGATRREWWLVAVGVILLISIPITSYLRGGGEFADFSVERANPASYEFGNSYLTLVDMVARVSKSKDLYLGSTYVAAVGILVPRAVWPNRPRSLPDWYVNTHYQRLARSGGGLAFSPVAEAYMNFGLLGVLGIFFGIGALAARFEGFIVLRLIEDPTWVLGYAIFSPWLLLFYRLDFGSFLKLGIVYTLALFLFMRILDQTLGFRRRRAQASDTST